MKYLFFLTSSLVLSTPAFAAEAVAEDVRPDDIVVLANGFEQPREETGQAISVVDRDRIEELQAVTVDDALRTLPGIAIARRGAVGGQTSVFVRGGNSSQTLVLIDGVRVNDVSSPNAAYDFGSQLATNIGRIEVLRGPNSIIWGSQAIGGVVNIETIRPTGPFGVDAGLEYGSNDTLLGHANISGTAGILEASFGGSYYRSDGISVFEGANAELDGSRIYALNGRLKANLTETFSLDFRGYFTDAVVNFDSRASNFLTGQNSGGANSLAIAYNKQFVAYAGANLDLADGRFRNRLAYTRTDVSRRGYDPVEGTYNNYLVNGTIDRVEYRGAYDLAEIATLSVGAEYEKIHSSTSYEGAPADLADNSVASGYGQLTVRPLEGLSLTGGVRYDSYSDYGGHTSLGGNLAYTPNGGRTVLRVTYGEGFRAPTLTEAQPPFGNINLKPETARNLDVGVEQALWGDRLRASATYFRRRTSNQIAYNPATFQSENIEKVDTDGVELALWGNLTDALRIEANYTMTDAINRSGANNGKRLQLRPQHSGSLSADWTSPLGLKVGGTLTVVGESFNDQANMQRIDGYALFDLRASYPLTDTVELYGRIENLFDEDYVVVTGYATKGRSAYVGARVRF